LVAKSVADLRDPVSLDLSEVTFIDSCGLRVVLELWREVLRYESPRFRAVSRISSR
jgi:anti-anti-sigma regulatory factor